ncbi:hypothetical protein PN290_06115 [Romboutsia sp. 1001216sp1]|uniref:hypothetical protein n=1 Tax=Romboutsia TaxID=1501226 RepID=UPI000B88119B|nr:MULTISPECIES: hypothetical protein [Romboutsia]MDB8793741.1 hypothetical protein [Romboutsia sp. 1001216sp1]MDB8795138.1 hypothetical protein [Romboutsia sp. 1001216sp1]MDB8798948.1 hypothetical protein [Romboutsia sp. 1001216sp1]
MEIKYTNNREDYIKGYEKSRKYALRKDVFTLASTMLILMGITFYFINEMSSFYNIEITLYVAVISILSATTIITTILLNIMSKKNIQKSIDKLIETRNSAMGPKLIEVKNDTIIHKGEKSYCEYNIKAIDNIYEEENVLVICIQKINPIIILPLNSFESKEVKNQFINMIKQKSEYLR